MTREQTRAHTLASLTASMEDVDCSWAMVMACIMLAQTNGSLSYGTALTAVGLHKDDYQEWKRRLSSVGRTLARRLAEAERGAA